MNSGNDEQGLNQKPVVCAIYSRVSTTKQAFQGVSLGQQEESLKDYATKKGWQVFQTCQDASESGKTMERPSVRGIFKDAAAGRFSKLLVYKRDRWTRNAKDFYNTYDQLHKLGVSLVIPDQIPDTDSPSGKAFMGVLAVFAELEGGIIMQRAIETTASLKAKGRVLGFTPYVYTPGFHTIVPDEEKLRVVRKVYDLFESGCSQREIVREVGLKRDRVRNILANPIYAGMVSYGRKRIAADQRTRKNDGIDDPSESVPKPTSDHVKVVVSYEEWCQVQAQIRNNFRFARATTHPLFQHLLHCSTCHHFLSAHGDAKGKTKYACENDREGRVKIGGQTNNSALHKGGRYYCGQQLWEQYLEYPVVQALDEAVREWKPVLDLGQDIENAQTKLSYQEGVETRNEANIGNPEIPYDVAKLRLDNAHAKVEDLRHELKRLKAKEASQDELKLILEKGFMELYYGKRRSKEQRQGLLQRLVRRIDVGPQELTISWLFMNDGKRPNTT